MKLKFRVETQKIKQPRIVVLRLLSERGKMVEKSLGSFNDKRSYDHIVKQLTGEELYEFENFVNVIHFSKSQFDCAADRLDRFIIKVAPEFKEALFKIWEKAKEHGIDFIPESHMLLSLFTKAKTVEQQLAVFTQGEFKALESLGIDITDISPPRRNAKEDQKLLMAVIENSPSREQLATLFNTIATEKYQKAPRFKPHHFDYLVQNAVKPSKKQPFPQWYYTVTIDVLNKLGVKPEHIVSPVLVAKHWLRLNKKVDFDRTLEAFHQEMPSLQDNPWCLQVIKNAFIEDELEKMYKNPLAQVFPSAAVERWLTCWQKKNPTLDQRAAIQAFNTEFTMLAGHPFFMGWIEKNLREENSV